MPWLGDIPILGALFSSSRYRKNETELVIIVTPKLVQPVSDISKIRTPLDDVTTPNELDLFLNGKLESPRSGNLKAPIADFTAQPAKTEAQGGLSASYGHVIQ